MEDKKPPEEEKKPFTLFKPKDRKGKPGRPPKSDLEAVRNRTKGKVGRPAGDAARLQEFKERLLATGGTNIIDKLVKIALNDDHPGQMAAIKLAMDRILPASVFEAKNGGSTPQISINITGLSAPTVETVEDITDVEVKPYDES
jgi:hypothetical protein